LSMASGMFADVDLEPYLKVTVFSSVVNINYTFSLFFYVVSAHI
jgi:hypothetical protein